MIIFLRKIRKLYHFRRRVKDAAPYEAALNNNFSYKQEIIYACCIDKSKFRFRHH